MKTIRLPIVTLLALGALFTATAPAAEKPAPPATETKPEPKKGPVIPYPLDVCLVTGNDLGSMGDEQRIVHEGREIKFCCKPCETKFLKNPARYLKKLEPEPAPAPAS